MRPTEVRRFWLTVTLIHLLIAQGAGAVSGDYLRIPILVQRIRIVTIGDGGQNSILRHVGLAPGAQVVDENGLPVPDATVTFTLPASRATGVFGNESRTFTGSTDVKGLLITPGLRPNNVAGAFQIQVKAEYHGLVSEATITQTNVLDQLRLITVDGDGAINSVQSRTSRDLGVMVVDSTSRPVEGVSVVFAVPSTGPGGAFQSGTLSETKVSNEKGMATATLIPNRIPGRFEIKVSIVYQGEAAGGSLVASASLAETNISGAAGAAAASGRKSSTLWVVAALVAGGAAGGALAAGKGGSTSTPAPPATALTLGPASVGPRP